MARKQNTFAVTELEYAMMNLLFDLPPHNVVRLSNPTEVRKAKKEREEDLRKQAEEKQKERDRKTEEVLEKMKMLNKDIRSAIESRYKLDEDDKRMIAAMKEICMKMNQGKYTKAQLYELCSLLEEDRNKFKRKVETYEILRILFTKSEVDEEQNESTPKVNFYSSY